MAKRGRSKKVKKVSNEVALDQAPVGYGEQASDLNKPYCPSESEMSAADHAFERGYELGRRSGSIGALNETASALSNAIRLLLIGAFELGQSGRQKE